jgi:hypothetical protein
MAYLAGALKSAGSGDIHGHPATGEAGKPQPDLIRACHKGARAL